MADLTGFRVKYTEEGGTQLWRQFPTKLDNGVGCGRDGCVTCEQLDEQKLDCYSRSVVYESVCLICHPDGRKAKPEDDMIQSGAGTYTGETSRSLFERAGEHYKDAKNLDKDCHIIKHWFLDHPSEVRAPTFHFKIIGKYKDCLTRKLKEAVRLQNRPGTLNSKGEFGGGRIPRMVIEKSEYESKREQIEEFQRCEEID